MALVVKGRIAALSPAAEDAVAAGRVWIGDDGTIDAVTGPRGPAPAGFDKAAEVDAGDALVLPGFVDLHSHLAYNTLPLWTEPSRTEPWHHRNEWPDADTYKAGVSWPAGTLLKLAPECLFTYFQMRALAGGTTSCQGWPPASRRPVNQLVRSVDNDRLREGVGAGRDPVLASVVPLDKKGLDDKLDHRDPAAVFVYHCAEGIPGSSILKEFTDLRDADCLKSWLIAIHGTALTAADFKLWKQRAGAKRAQAPGTVVWSPLSNLWLYGRTTDIPAALAAKLRVTIGTDWGPSGTKNLLGELKVARLHADRAGWTLTDHDLVRMVTAAPGDALAGAWGEPVGRLVPGGPGDLVVLAKRGAKPWRNVVAARERDVKLVVVGGRARLGTAELMRAAGVRTTTSVPVDGETRRAALVLPGDPTKPWTWRDALTRLDAVRKDAAVHPPSGEHAGPGGGPELRPGIGDPPGTPPLAARLDMPAVGGEGQAGPPPPGQTVVIPKLEPLHHDARWLASVRNRGFHAGLLDGLAAFWR